ncbi:glycosyltransferase family 4 protein [Mycobacterium sp. LTG2003]
MRITIIGINYAPEVTGIAPYTTGLAEGLAARGHDITVVTGLPHYPEWRIADAYANAPRSSVEVINGVTIRRVRHVMPETPSTKGRVRMEASFALAAARSGWNRPDVVLTVSPPLLASCAVVGRARAQRIPVGVVVQDLYGKGVVETSAMGGRGAAATTKLEVGMLSHATGVSVIHDRFADVLSELGVDRHRITVVRNWTHIDIPTEDSDSTRDVRAKYGWNPDEVVVVHAGNMGAKQGLENVVAAAKLVDRSDAPLRFVLLGDGNQRKKLEEAAVGAKSLQFIRPVPADEFTKVLKAADVLLVNEKPDVADMAVPSKLTSYFVSGRPVVAATSDGSATAYEVRSSGAGVIVPADDPETLVSAAHRIGADKAAGLQMGQSGQRYAKDVLDESSAIDRYERWCSDLVARSR